MNDFWFYTKFGFNHVLDIHAYDHVLFFAALVVPYLFKDWKKVLGLVTLFTIGHTLTLLLVIYAKINFNSAYVEFLIPVTIVITALYNVFTAGKATASNKVNLVYVTSLFFGIIHGLGFSRAFRHIIADQDYQLVKTLEFALGIEAAQLIVAFIILLLGGIIQTIFRFNRRDWVLVLSSIIIGVAIPMLIATYPF